MFSAINADSPSGAAAGGTDGAAQALPHALLAGGQTLEAASARAAASHQAALRAAAAGDPAGAAAGFEDLLAQPLIVAASDGQVAHSSALAIALRASALKNLAGILAGGGSGGQGKGQGAGRALALYAEAALLDGSDVLAWQRAAELAGGLGLWGAAKRAAECGLVLAPAHPLLLEAAAEAAMRLGDWPAGRRAARRLGASRGGDRARAALIASAARRQSVAGLTFRFPPRVLPQDVRAAAAEELAAAAPDTAPRPEVSAHRRPLLLDVPVPTWAALLTSLAGAVDTPGAYLGGSVAVTLGGRAVTAADAAAAAAAAPVPPAAVPPPPPPEPSAQPAPAAAGRGRGRGRARRRAAAAPLPRTTRAASAGGARAIDVEAAGAPSQAAAAALPPTPPAPSFPPPPVGHTDALAPILPSLGAPPAVVAPARAPVAPRQDARPGSARPPPPASDAAAALAEAAAVVALLAGPTPASGLGALAAAALTAACAAAYAGAVLPGPAVRAAARLDDALAGWPRPHPAASLALAELRALAAADPAAWEDEEDVEGGTARPLGQQQLTGAAGRAATAAAGRAAEAALAAAAPAAAAVDRRLASSSTPISPSDRAFSARFHWAAALLAETGRHAASATAHHAAVATACGEDGWEIELPHLAAGRGPAAAAASLLSASGAAARARALALAAVLDDGHATVQRGDVAGATKLVAALAGPVLSGGAAAASAGGGRGGLDARRVLNEAALLLAESASLVGPSADGIRFRAGLVVLTSMLPRAPPPLGGRDPARVAAPPAGPPPPGIADPARAARPRLDKAIARTASLAADIAGRPPAARAAVLGDGGGGGSAGPLIHEAAWALAAHVERCFWALAPAAAPTDDPARLGAVQGALAAGATALLALWRLDAAADGSPAAAAGLATGLAALLGGRALPAPRWVGFLWAAAGVLADAKDALPPPAAIDDDEGEGGTAALVRGAHGAALHALFGAHPPERDPAWPAPPPPPGGLARLATPADAVAAWRLLGGLAQAADRRCLGRLGPALRAIARALPGPAPAVLAASPDPATLLDGQADPTDAGLAASSPCSPLPPSLSVAPSLSAAIAADPASAIAARLHAMLLPEGGELEAGAWAPGMLASPSGLNPDGLAAVDESASDALAALRFDPACRPAWAALAALYGGAADALAADVARAGPALARPGGRRSWEADPPHPTILALRSRLAAWRRRSVRAHLAVRALAMSAGDASAVAAADLAVGRAHLAALSRAPPAGPRARPLPPGVALVHATAAVEACSRAAAGAPADWQAPYWQGRAVEKAAVAARAAERGAWWGGGGGVGGGGARALPPSSSSSRLAALPLYAAACERAAAAHGGSALLDPLYRLHASRLKACVAAGRAVAGAGGGPRGAAAALPTLRAAGAHCFLPETGARLAPFLAAAEAEAAGFHEGAQPAPDPEEAEVASFSDDADSEPDFPPPGAGRGGASERGGGGGRDGAEPPLQKRRLSPPLPPPSSSSSSSTLSALNLLHGDAIAALRWMAGADRYFHRARRRAARGLAAGAPLGGEDHSSAPAAAARATAALAELRPLFTSGKSPYCIQLYQGVSMPTEGGGGRGGRGGGEVEQQEEEAPAAALAPASAPSAGWSPAAGGRPPSAAGAGLDEPWTTYARSVASAARSHARAAAGARDGGALSAAVAFLTSRSAREREGLPGLEAPGRLALGLHFREVVYGLMEASGGWLVRGDGLGVLPPQPTPTVADSPFLLLAPPPARPPPSQPLSDLFARASGLYVEYALADPAAGRGGGGEGGAGRSWGDLTAAAAAASPAPAPSVLGPAPTPWADERTFLSAARAHVACLEAEGGYKAATALAGTLRRRFRPLREAPAPARTLASEAFAAAGRALAAGVASLEGAAAAGLAAEKAQVAAAGAPAAVPPSAADAKATALASRAAGAAASNAAGWPAESAWALLSGASALRRQGPWTHADGDAGPGVFEGSGEGGGGKAPAPASQLDLDRLLVRAYGSYCALRHGLAGGDPAPTPSLADALAGVEHLARLAKRGGGGAPLPPR